MVSEKCIVPQLQPLTAKETKLNALKIVREAVSLIYKALQEENESMSKIIEATMSKSRG